MALTRLARELTQSQKILPIEIPGKPIEIPGKPIEIPGKPIEIPGKPIEIPGEPGECHSPLRYPSSSIAIQTEVPDFLPIP
jgi:hypothetical protein